MSANYDVVIVGGGIAGLSLASALAGKCSVALVEAEQSLAYHTSARSARQLIPSYGPPVVQELTLRTLELIGAQDGTRPEPVLSPRSFMLIGDEDSRPGSRPAATCTRSATPRPWSSARPCNPDSFAAAGLDTGSFACNAPLLLEDHRERAEAGGVDIITGARVHSAQRLGSGWELGAGQEGFQAAVVVNAAGAWADELAVLSGVEKLGLQPYRRTAAIVDVEHPLPQGCPMVAAADDSFYFRPDGRRQVLISPSETVPSGPEDAQPYPGDVEALIARLNTVTTLGIGGVRRAWTGLRTEAADGVPVVGFDAEAPGFFWLAGQGGYGFQTSSGIAELAAELILAGQGAAEPRPADSPASRTAAALAATRLVHPALKNGPMSTLITNIAELMTQDAEHRVLKDAAVVIEGERIAWLGAAADAPAADEAVDAGGRALLPGWVDSHTHLIFAGDRTAEFEARMAGEGYSAGGIAVTTGATRSHRRLRPHPARAGPRRRGRLAGHHLPGNQDRLRPGRGQRGPQRPDRLHRRGRGHLPRRAPGPGRHGRRGVHGPGLRSHARRGPALRPLGRRLLRARRLHRGPVPPRAPGLPGRRAWACACTATSSARAPACGWPWSSAPRAWTT